MALVLSHAAMVASFTVTVVTAMSDDRKPLDHAFLDGMRKRIKVADIIDKFQAHVRDPAAHPLRMSQLKAGEILLRKCIPDLKAVEHTDAPERKLSREQLIERLTNLYAAAAGQHDGSATHGVGPADGTAEARH